KLAQKLVDRLTHIMQMIVNEVTLAAIWRGDPLSTRNMHAADARKRETGEKLQRIEPEVDRVGVEIVQIKQQIAAARRHDIRNPGRLRELAARRVNQSRDILHERL